MNNITVWSTLISPASKLLMSKHRQSSKQIFTRLRHHDAVLYLFPNPLHISHWPSDDGNNTPSIPTPIQTSATFHFSKYVPLNRFPPVSNVSQTLNGFLSLSVFIYSNKYLDPSMYPIVHYSSL